MNEAIANDDGASCWCDFTHAWWILSIAVRVGGKPVSSRSYSYLNEAASSFFHGGVIECSSRMRGNFQVRFLEGWAAARPPGHSTVGNLGTSAPQRGLVLINAVAP